MNRVKDKVCVVSGAARGLGLAAAEALLAEGAKVLLTDVSASGASLAEGLGPNAMFLTHDVCKEDQWKSVLDAVVGKWGRLDVLVNNAGVGAFRNIEQMTVADWRRTLDVNLDGVMLGTQQAIARMRASGGGSIINMASIEGLVGDGLLPAYNASKGAVRLLTRSAAIHCARSGYGIRINTICPGFVETQLVSDALAVIGGERAQTLAVKTLERIPMGRFAKPAEIAMAVLFLASDESSYVTGSDLVIDGGMTA